MNSRIVSVALLVLALVISVVAQTPAATPAPAQVPPVIQFQNIAADDSGNPLTGEIKMTFSLYANSRGTEPLWQETQTVQPDRFGHYSVYIGISKPGGVPATLFTAGQAHWLGVKIAGQAEQPKVFLVSVPYAIKAGDAATIGGLPPSAFVLAAAGAISGTDQSSGAPSPGTVQSALGGAGTTNFLPLWTPDGATLGNSVLFQSGTGTTAKVGVNTTSPAATLDVKGAATVRGALALPPIAPATATAGKTSQPFNVIASSFNSGTNAPVNQVFAWQAEPAANNTAGPGGTLNLLFGAGTATPVETGLRIAKNGQITFAPGQTFPGGSGTITGVIAGTDLTGGGSRGTVTLNLDTTKIPQLNAANTFTVGQTVHGNLSATGVVTGSSFQIGSNLFGFGSIANQSAFVGFAGNTTSTGQYNFGAGYQALHSNTGGKFNTAVGDAALEENTSGSSNTAVGQAALNTNTTGIENTAVGAEALADNTTGSDNTAFGEFALVFNQTGSDNTALGQGALGNNQLGSSNTATGYQALASTQADRNTADGFEALEENSTGTDNVADGEHALLNNTSGADNTAVGAGALESNESGSMLTCVGFLCTATANATVNATAVGAHAIVDQSNSLVLGGSGQFAVKVGIGTATPSNVLTIARGTGHPVSDSWETYSSRRWKTNIKTLPDALSKVEQLRGVTYDLKDNGKHEIGVIAEEVGAVVPEVVSWEKNGTDAQGVDYSRLTALLIEAVKAQQKQIARLTRAAASQKREAAAQRDQIRSLFSQLKSTRTGLQSRLGQLHDNISGQ